MLFILSLFYICVKLSKVLLTKSLKQHQQKFVVIDMLKNCCFIE
ncbi:hypothetical protein GPAL_3624 [Glaciecola pallidula DSM 14239 = ACAM 615]|uniref:Uncharacterized protein n=1 Tax=Brumicola pallidula DSM 14239 = ACAM 615 TaxID=1121922 RepID=K6Z2M3_9ALTE|nr:hypothetical protein GPAL_3624 [Glaciecola pallidula DSM 14239 = ACAM 615]